MNVERGSWQREERFEETQGEGRILVLALKLFWPSAILGAERASLSEFWTPPAHPPLPFC